jgi:hypothetical protein
LSDVDIRVKMEDQTGDAAKSVTDNLQKMEGAAKTADSAHGRLGGALKGLVSNANEVAQSLTGMNLAQLSATGLIIGATTAVKEAIGEYTSYVQTIDKMAMATGTSTEEMSRLVQVADDYRVETSSLENAMKLALQNGFTPTIENLAALADEYVAIQDPTARAEKMQRIFGRSWADLVPLLEAGGDAIREASGEVAESLIVTEAAKERAEEYRLALDAWNDAVMGVKYSLAEELLPVLTEFINAQTEGADAIAEGYGKIEGLGGAYTIIAIAQKQASEAGLDWNDAEREAMKAAQYANDQTQDLTDSTDDLTASTAWASRSAKAYGDRLQAQADAAKRYKDIQDKLKQATDDLAAAQQNWNQGAGSDIVSMLNEAGVKGENYQKALEATDEILGTGFGAQNKYMLDLKSMVGEYAKSGDVATFKKRLDELTETYRPLDEAVAAALKTSQDLNAELAAIPPVIHSWIYIHKVKIDEGEYDGTDTQDPGEKRGGLQEMGAAHLLAPTGNSYGAGLGTQTNYNQSFGGVSIIIPGASDPGETAERVRRVLGDSSDRARASGAKYQGWNQ